MNISKKQNRFFKHMFLVTVLVFMLFVFSGCVQQLSVEESEASADSAQKPLIVATFNPLADVARAIAGDTAVVVQLVPSGAEPHDFDPSPQDIRQLARASIVLANGAGLDSWIDELVAASKNPNVTIIRADSDIALLTHEEHEEEHAESESAQSELDHESESEHHDEGVDPHLWLSPKNMVSIATRVADVLSTVDPSHAQTYAVNAAAYVSELETLDSELRLLFDSCANKDFIILHGFLRYFCQEYGCEQVGVQGISPEADITPKQLALAIDLAKEHNITTVVAEAGSSVKTEQAIADAIGGTVIEISPFERKSSTDSRDYIATMQSNAQAFKSALQC